MLPEPERPLDQEPPLAVVDAIRQRRTTRRFDPGRTIPNDVLRQILNLATFAPSSFNLQPWRFLLVRNPRNRETLRECAFNNPVITQAPVVVIVLGYHHPDQSHLGAMIATQSELGVITLEAAAELRARAIHSMQRANDRTLWATRSTMMAAATMMVAAESLGIASAFIDRLDCDKVTHAFGIPEDHTVCCLIALGFAAESAPFPGRFGLDEIVFEDHFGQPSASIRETE